MLQTVTNFPHDTAKGDWKIISACLLWNCWGTKRLISWIQNRQRLSSPYCVIMLLCTDVRSALTSLAPELSIGFVYWCCPGIRAGGGAGELGSSSVCKPNDGLWKCSLKWIQIFSEKWCVTIFIFQNKPEYTFNSKEPELLVTISIQLLHFNW